MHRRCRSIHHGRRHVLELIARELDLCRIRHRPRRERAPSRKCTEFVVARVLDQAGGVIVEGEGSSRVERQLWVICACGIECCNPVGEAGDGNVLPIIGLCGNRCLNSKHGVAGADATAKDKTHLLKIVDGIRHIVLCFDPQRIARRVVRGRRPCLAAPSAIQIRIDRTAQHAVQDHRVVDGLAVIRTPTKYTIHAIA